MMILVKHVIISSINGAKLIMVRIMIIFYYVGALSIDYKFHS